MVAVAIEPATQGDDEKLTTSLARLCEEDLMIHFEMDPATHEMILSGMGQIHIEVTLSRLRERFGISVNTHPPKIAYKETIRKKATGHGRLKKQTGGHGQFADCSLEIEPTANGDHFEFVNAIVGGVIPKQYIPGVEKGVLEAMTKGELAGYPVTGLKVTLFDGKFHDVDSSEMAFRTAASLAFKEAFLQASPVLLEPIMELEIVSPDETIGDVMADLAQKRGKVLGMGVMGGNQQIKATAPLAEILSYEQDINAMTSGRGVFTMSFHNYEEAPQNVAKKIIDQSASPSVGEA
jgi:elongation factor G